MSDINESGIAIEYYNRIHGIDGGRLNPALSANHFIHRIHRTINCLMILT
jgi:hypothetical protein